MLGTDRECGALKGLDKIFKQKPLFLLEYNFLIYLVFLLNFWHISCCVRSSRTAGSISGDQFLSAFLSSAHLFCICSLMWELVYRYNSTHVWKQFLKKETATDDALALESVRVKEATVWRDTVNWVMKAQLWGRCWRVGDVKWPPLGHCAVSCGRYVDHICFTWPGAQLGLDCTTTSSLSSV